MSDTNSTHLSPRTTLRPASEWDPSLDRRSGWALSSWTDLQRPHPEATEETTDLMHARYYSPGSGRFLSVDPVGGSVGSSQSWNRYSYVNDNPLNLTDPSGMCESPYGCFQMEHPPSEYTGPRIPKGALIWEIYKQRMDMRSDFGVGKVLFPVTTPEEVGQLIGASQGIGKGWGFKGVNWVAVDLSGWLEGEIGITVQKWGIGFTTILAGELNDWGLPFKHTDGLLGPVTLGLGGNDVTLTSGFGKKGVGVEFTLNLTTLAEIYGDTGFDLELLMNECDSSFTCSDWLDTYRDDETERDDDGHGGWKFH